MGLQEIILSLMITKQTYFNNKELAAMLISTFFGGLFIPFIIPSFSDYNYINVYPFAISYYIVFVSIFLFYPKLNEEYRYNAPWFYVFFCGISFIVSVSLFYGFYYGLLGRTSQYKFSETTGRLMKYDYIMYRIAVYDYKDDDDDDVFQHFWNLKFQIEIDGKNATGCGCGSHRDLDYYHKYLWDVYTNNHYRYSRFPFNFQIPKNLCYCNEHLNEECSEFFPLIEEKIKLYYKIIGNKALALNNTECLPKTKDFVLVYKHSQARIPKNEILTLAAFMTPFLVLGYSYISVIIFGEIILKIINCFCKNFTNKYGIKKKVQEGNEKETIEENKENNKIVFNNYYEYKFDKKNIFGKNGFVYNLGKNKNFYQNIYTIQLADIATEEGYYNLTGNEKNGFKNLSVLFGILVLIM